MKRKRSTVHDAAAFGLLQDGVCWSEHPDFPHYLIGVNGDVISLLNYPPKILSAAGNTPYPTHTLRSWDGKLKCVTKHALVALTWIGERPDGTECCHNDGNRKNADISNLRWDTPVNNNRDKIKHGTHRAGEAINFAKLNTEAVIRIRFLWRDGLSRREIARKFRISTANVRAVAIGASWAHIREGLDD